MKPATKTELAVVGVVSLRPHPDGKPWDKCCGNKGEFDCLCLMRKPLKGLSRYDRIMGGGLDYGRRTLEYTIEEMGRFFCVHRSTDDGFHRECAGWAAKITGNKP